MNKLPGIYKLHTVYIELLDQIDDDRGDLKGAKILDLTLNICMRLLSFLLSFL